MNNFIQKQIESSERLYKMMLDDHRDRIEKITTVYELSENLQKKINERDAEIEKLYNMIHAQYTNYGGINSNLWLNLYNSFWSMHIDRATPTDSHPGHKSQYIFSNYLAPLLSKKIQ